MCVVFVWFVWPFSFAIILKRKRELVALLCCLANVLLLYMLCSVALPFGAVG